MGGGRFETGRDGKVGHVKLMPVLSAGWSALRLLTLLRKLFGVAPYQWLRAIDNWKLVGGAAEVPTAGSQIPCCRYRVALGQVVSQEWCDGVPV